MKFAQLSATALTIALFAISVNAEEPTAATIAAPTEAAAPIEAAAPAAATPATSPNTPSLSKAVTDAVGSPPEGKGLVVFFRPSKFAGGAVGFIVREGTNELGKLRNGNYFAVAVEPGTHTYIVHSEAKDVTNIEVEAGETYFLTGSISFGFMAGHPNLSPSDAAAFEAILPKLKPSKPLDK